MILDNSFLFFFLLFFSHELFRRHKFEFNSSPQIDIIIDKFFYNIRTMIWQEFKTLLWISGRC